MSCSADDDDDIPYHIVLLSVCATLQCSSVYVPHYM
jgi:hypothetical protein